MLVLLAFLVSHGAAVSGGLHAWLHDTEAAGPHVCAATLLTQGLADVSEPLTPLLLPAEFPGPAWRPTGWVVSVPDFLLLPGRAPPLPV